MPTIASHNLQLNPRSLQDISGLDPTWFPEAMSWAGRANQMDTTTLEDAMRAAAHEKAMDPLRLRKQQADIDQTIASTGLTKANTVKQDMENEVYGATKKQRIETEGRKLLSEASDADLKILESQVYTALQSKDPKEWQAAQAIVPHLKFAVQERFKTDQQLRVQGSANAAAMARQKQQQEHQIELEKMRVDRALKVAEIGASARRAAASAKTPKDWEALATSLAQQMLTETDAEVKAALVQQIEYAQAMAERLKNMPPQVDPAAFSNSKLKDPKTVPMPTAPGVGKPDPLGIR